MLTRVELDTEVVSNAREALEAVGLSTAVDGSNVDLSFLEARTLSYLGVLPPNRADVTDADLAGLDDSVEPRFVDMVMIVVLERCRRGIVMQPQSQSWKNHSVNWGDARVEISRMLAEAKADFRARWLHQGVPRSGRLGRANRPVLHPGRYFRDRHDRHRFVADFDL
jgi:hypothetical protein